MTDLSDNTAKLLRALARSVAEHRSAGGKLDDLAADQREMLQALSELQRQFFMQELAMIQAENGKRRFREQLGSMLAGEPRKTPGPTG